MKQPAKKLNESEGEAAASPATLSAMFKQHGEALKSIRDKIKADPAYEKEYGPAMDEVLSHHEKMSKATEKVGMNLGTPAASSPAEGEGAAGAGGAPTDTASSDGVEESFKKMEAEYKAGKLSEGERKVFELLLRQRTEQGIRENARMIADTLKESGIPDAYQGDLAILCAGRPEAQVKKLVEARKSLIAPLLGNRATGAGAGAGGGSATPSKLAEKMKASGVKLKEVAAA